MQNCISDLFLGALCIMHHCIISALMFQKFKVIFFSLSPLSGKLLYDASYPCLADKKKKKALSTPKVLKRLKKSHCHAIQGKLI